MPKMNLHCLHSSTSQLNLSRFLSLKFHETTKCIRKERSRHAEKWTSVSPWVQAVRLDRRWVSAVAAPRVPWPQTRQLSRVRRAVRYRSFLRVRSVPPSRPLLLRVRHRSAAQRQRPLRRRRLRSAARRRRRLPSAAAAEPSGLLPHRPPPARLAAAAALSGRPQRLRLAPAQARSAAAVVGPLGRPQQRLLPARSEEELSGRLQRELLPPAPSAAAAAEAAALGPRLRWARQHLYPSAAAARPPRQPPPARSAAAAAAVGSGRLRQGLTLVHF